MNLTDRVRGILTPTAPVPASDDVHGPPFRPYPEGCSTPRTSWPGSSRALEQVLGGEWRHEGHAPCFVVEQRVRADSSHGRASVGDLAAQLEASATYASLLTGLKGGAPARPPFLFFDLETTGLCGGAGTYAFVVGCGRFVEDGTFLTNQYVLVNYRDERPMLETVARELGRAGALVSFNGKSFDQPVLETRYLLHRIDWAGAGLPHIDVLHPARRFWGNLSVRRAFQARLDRGPDLRHAQVTPSTSRGGRAARQDESSCSLVSLEAQVLGARRIGDVPGFEIPRRYFGFVRSGDARPLAAVLEHNRLDLLSLAGLTARLLQLMAEGPASARDAREALALGRVYSRAGLDARARDAFVRAVAMADHSASRWAIGDSRLVKIAALRALAVAERRSGRYPAAAACWRQILEAPACPPDARRDANEALAIHHEHRLRDLPAAKEFALRNLNTDSRPARHAAVQRRLRRIERKMRANLKSEV